ncbi:MAG: hypothetical protein JSV22_13680, partial [Bacteroidales bacterium]
LNESIRVIPGHYKDKAVKSVRSIVANIKDYLQSDLDIIEFRDLLLNHILTEYRNSKIYNLSKADKENIMKLAKVKYSTWEWIYGYSPGYSLDVTFRIGKEDLKFSLIVENGIIKDIQSKDDSINESVLSEVSALFKGVPHRDSDLIQKTAKLTKLLSITKAEADKLIFSMF